mmetsp:Transcript_112264/g.194612  ORF Transcript_112264/g.194612 Transcript_112264/m.194612 type:complete len:308 (+) Transcript_112264:181-1104(+)
MSKRDITSSSSECKKQKQEDPPLGEMITDPQLRTLFEAIQLGRSETKERFDRIESTVDGLKGRMSEQEKKTDARMKIIEQEIAQLRRNIRDDSSSNSSRSSSTARDVRPDDATYPEDQYSLPVAKRRVIALGGFPHEMAQEELVTIVQIIYKQAGDGSEVWLDEVVAPYKLGQLAKIRLKTSRMMWLLLSRMKGKKFTYMANGMTTNLWHGVDKSPTERRLSKTLVKAADVIRNYLKITGLEDVEELKKAVVVDYSKSIVFTKLADKNVRRVLCQATSDELQVVSNYNPDDILGFPAQDYLDQINLQ